MLVTQVLLNIFVVVRFGRIITCRFLKRFSHIIELIILKVHTVVQFGQKENEIYDALEYSTRHSREQATDPDDLPHIRLEDEFEQHMLCGALFDQLDRAEATATGTVGKGIQAIRLLAQGYTNREIGERFHAPANHVTAWVAKARKYLAAMTA